MDPSPDYNVSDELEYGLNWFAWILRGVPAAGLPAGLNAIATRVHPIALHANGSRPHARRVVTTIK